MNAPRCGDRNLLDPGWPTDPPKIAHGCGATMHAIQYFAGEIAGHLVRPSTCLVCPKCDAP